MEAHYVAQLKELNDSKLFRSAYMLVRLLHDFFYSIWKRY